MAELGSDKRIAPRRPVTGEAEIIAPGVKETCIIRDLSATGAKIEISRKVNLPEEFEVLLAKTNSRRRVLLRWRHGNFIGVQFRSASHPSTAGKR
jgi:hypothetical protein